LNFNSFLNFHSDEDIPAVSRPKDKKDPKRPRSSRWDSLISCEIPYHTVQVNKNSKIFKKNFETKSTVIFMFGNCNHQSPKIRNNSK